MHPRTALDSADARPRFRGPRPFAVLSAALALVVTAGCAVSDGDEPSAPPPPPPTIPRGCHPLVIGVVLATVEMAVILWLLYR